MVNLSLSRMRTLFVLVGMMVAMAVSTPMHAAPDKILRWNAKKPDGTLYHMLPTREMVQDLSIKDIVAPRFPILKTPLFQRYLAAHPKLVNLSYHPSTPEQTKELFDQLNALRREGNPKPSEVGYITTFLKRFLAMHHSMDNRLVEAFIGYCTQHDDKMYLQRKGSRRASSKPEEEAEESTRENKGKKSYRSLKLHPRGPAFEELMAEKNIPLGILSPADLEFRTRVFHDRYNMNNINESRQALGRFMVQQRKEDGSRLYSDVEVELAGLARKDFVRANRVESYRHDRMLETPLQPTEGTKSGPSTASESPHASQFQPDQLPSLPSSLRSLLYPTPDQDAYTSYRQGHEAAASLLPVSHLSPAYSSLPGIVYQAWGSSQNPSANPRLEDLSPYNWRPASLSDTSIDLFYPHQPVQPFQGHQMFHSGSQKEPSLGEHTEETFLSMYPYPDSFQEHITPGWEDASPFGGYQSLVHVTPTIDSQQQQHHYFPQAHMHSMLPEQYSNPQYNVQHEQWSLPHEQQQLSQMPQMPQQYDLTFTTESSAQPGPSHMWSGWQGSH